MYFWNVPKLSTKILVKSIRNSVVFIKITKNGPKLHKIKLDLRSARWKQQRFNQEGALWRGGEKSTKIFVKSIRNFVVSIKITKTSIEIIKCQQSYNRDYTETAELNARRIPIGAPLTVGAASGVSFLVWLAA